MSEERVAFLEYVSLSPKDDERWVRVTYQGPAFDIDMLTALASFVAHQTQRLPAAAADTNTDGVKRDG